jgi:putative transcriptional regulator
MEGFYMWPSRYALMKTGTMSVGLSQREGLKDMKKTATIRVTRKVGDPLPKRDHRPGDALTEEQRHAAALSDPDAKPWTKEQLANARRVSRVKVLRQRLDMTQEQFAQTYGIPVATLRDWEQRRSVPDQTARTLLKAIEKDPETMRKLLQPA